jgi:RimJ/RimL family protein N-acetyltransferase
MASVLADPALYEFTGGEPPDPQTLRERFARLVIGHSDDGAEIWHNWIVRTNADRAAVGTVQATLSPGETTAEIAWVIGFPWQGLGYASEAAQALVAWLDGLGVTTITAHIHAVQHASTAVATRAGLTATDELEDGERVWRRTVLGG